MQLDNFEVTIPEGRGIQGGYVELAHEQQYSIIITNRLGRKCDAELKVDGKHIETFQLHPYGSTSVLGPPDDPLKGRFTVYLPNTSEGHAAGVDQVNNLMRGLIEVTFRPEKVVVYNYSSSYPVASLGGDTMRSAYDAPQAKGGPSSASHQSAGTGLSGQHNQKWQTVTAVDFDPNDVRTITLRIVVPKSSGPRPLMSHSTPVPPPV